MCNNSIRPPASQCLSITVKDYVVGLLPKNSIIVLPTRVHIEGPPHTISGCVQNNVVDRTDHTSAQFISTHTSSYIQLFPQRGILRIIHELQLVFFHTTPWKVQIACMYIQ